MCEVERKNGSGKRVNGSKKRKKERVKLNKCRFEWKFGSKSGLKVKPINCHRKFRDSNRKTQNVYLTRTLNYLRLAFERPS